MRNHLLQKHHTTTEDNPYTIYPSVAKTASINGFADRIYDQLPECAKPCMFQNTGVTPCPYWDTGCLCIMPTFAGAIGSCIAEKCKGQDVVAATSLGTSICSVAGVWDPYWMVPANVQSSLSAAATAVASSSEQPVETSSEPAESSQSVESSQPAETSSSEPAETSSETSSEQPVHLNLLRLQQKNLLPLLQPHQLLKITHTPSTQVPSQDCFYQWFC